MSPNRSKQLIWIGGGIAVAAVLAVAFLTIDYPPDSRKTAGTVAPAQRYRAEQPQAGDVKLGDQAVAQLMQTEAFDRFVKDPSTRALALDPNFQALAKYHADALRTVAARPETAAVLIAYAKSRQTAARQETAAVQQASAKSTFNTFGTQAEAVHMFAASPEFMNVAAKNADSFVVAAKSQNFAVLVGNTRLSEALRLNALAEATQPTGTANNAQQQQK